MRLPKEFLNDPVKLAVRDAYQKIAAQGRIPTDEEINAELSPELANDRRRCSEIIQAAQAQIEAKRPRAPDHGSMEWVHRTYAKIQAIRERPLNLMTLCSGIGAPEEAVRQLRLRFKTRLVAYSEIATAPAAVMAHHYPGVPNLGDISAKDYLKRAKAIAARPDIIVAGTPCQSFSIAGLRKGLSSANGNLCLTAIQIVNELKPDLYLWENVDGARTDKTNALGCIIPALCGGDEEIHSGLKNGIWPVAGVAEGPRRRLAWRVMDAKHYGVPARRERIFLLAAERSSGIDPAAILLD